MRGSAKAAPSKVASGTAQQKQKHSLAMSRIATAKQREAEIRGAWQWRS
jgi:hypothetical protein